MAFGGDGALLCHPLAKGEEEVKVLDWIVINVTTFYELKVSVDLICSLFHHPTIGLRGSLMVESYGVTIFSGYL